MYLLLNSYRINTSEETFIAHFLSDTLKNTYKVVT